MSKTKAFQRALNLSYETDDVILVVERDGDYIITNQNSYDGDDIVVVSFYAGSVVS